MPISESEVRSITQHHLAAQPDVNDAMCEASISVGLAVLSSISIKRDSHRYWVAVGHALRMKAMMCHAGMDPGPDWGHTDVFLTRREGEMFISVLGHFIEVLAYVHDHFPELPPSVPMHRLTVLHVARRLEDLDQEHQAYIYQSIVNQVFQVPRHRFQDISRWADDMLEILTGQELFPQFCSEFAKALRVVQKVQAVVTSGPVTGQ